MQPAIVAIAGPNGAGKSTFYASQLAPAGLVFVNADVMALEANLEPYQAARLADLTRRQLLDCRVSFAFETVFSDPVGDKVDFLKLAVDSGYRVTLCYIGLSSSELSLERVAMRVTKGGHDVPDDKIESRYPRCLENLRRAIAKLPEVRIFDNSDLRTPYEHLATFRNGRPEYLRSSLPVWVKPIF